jgi:hydrogenase nickel incorporation protein HypA/HybF
MHELSITQSLVDLALDEGKKAGVKKIRTINLVIGEMSGVVDASVNFYFSFLSKGTAAEGATLKFNRIPMMARCRDCNAEFRMGEFDWSCPSCKRSSLDIIAGDELRIESIEVE